MWIVRSSFFYKFTCFIYCSVMCLSGEVTEDELFSRLQQIKDGPEQQNDNSSPENGEDPVGKFAFSSVFLEFVFYYQI